MPFSERKEWKCSECGGVTKAESRPSTCPLHTQATCSVCKNTVLVRGTSVAPGDYLCNECRVKRMATHDVSGFFTDLPSKVPPPQAPLRLPDVGRR